MRLVICGTDKKAYKIKLLLDKFVCFGIKIVMFIGPIIDDFDYNDIPIISESDLLCNDYSEYIDGFVISPEYYGLTRLSIYNKLKLSIYANKKIYMPEFEMLRSQKDNVYFDIKKVLVPYEDSSQLFYLEVHAADHCNLNCKGCMHFSPLLQGEVFPNFDQFREDIYHLKKFIKHIDIIRILGGEPLLNPNLDKYILLLREVYSFANIIIVTNGILLEKMSNLLCESIRNNNIHIHVSLYPPMEKRKEEIESFFKRNNVKYRISKCINTFTSTFSSKPFSDKLIAKEKCDIFCNNLRDGYISCCPHMIYTHYFNEYFGASYPVEDGLINIYEIKSARELHQRLNKPTSLCAYCDRSVHFKWEITKKIYLEWISI